MFVFCITIVKTLIFICGFLAEKTKEKAYLLSYSKSIILQLGKITRESVWGEKRAYMCLEREVESSCRIRMFLSSSIQ